MPFLYHSQAEVQAELKNIDIQATGTIIITSQIEGYMTASESVITGKIGRRYSMPITLAVNPVSYSILNKIAILLTAGRCEQILRRNAVENGNASDLTKNRSMIKEAETMIDDILSDTLLLTDATRYKAISTNVSYDNSGGAPVIQKGVKQW